MTVLFPFLVMNASLAEPATEPIVLNVALYQDIPNYNSFADHVIEYWKEIHPDVKLNLVEWNCYKDPLPEDLDVFVFDVMVLDTFAQRGDLLALSKDEIKNYDDLIPSIMEGCLVNGTIYGVPQFLCMELLFTRKEDTELASAKNIDDLYKILGDSGLLMDEVGIPLEITMYLNALVDESNHYVDQFPPIDEGSMSQKAIDSLTKMTKMLESDFEGVPEDDWYYYTRKFAEGMGRAYIGYSESLALMGDAASDMYIRPFSMTSDDNILVFYVDSVSINAHISEDKKALALELLNMLTDTETIITLSLDSETPRYLLSARKSFYDALVSKYPIYTEESEVLTPC